MTGKAWGVVFVCNATSQVLFTDSFLMVLRRFLTIHGALRRFQSDQGEQIIATSKQLTFGTGPRWTTCAAEGRLLEAGANWWPAL
jgi:hypothetical protein